MPAVLDIRSQSTESTDSDWLLENQLVGLVNWLEFGDIEDQLRFVRPIVFRRELKTSMLPFYALLADSNGYRMRIEPGSRAATRVYFLREQHSKRTTPVAA